MSSRIHLALVAALACTSSVATAAPKTAKRLPGHRTIHTSSARFRVNSNYEFKCRPGSPRIDSFDSPFTMLTLQLPSFTLSPTFVTNVDSVRAQAGIGDQCGKYAHLMNQPNPHWVNATVKRTVVEKLNVFFGNRCHKALEETLEVKLDGVAATFSGTRYIQIGYVPMSKCRK